MVLPNEHPASSGLAAMERIALQQFIIKPSMRSQLSKVLVDPTALPGIAVKVSNMWEWWESTYGVQFFDMSTVVRIGTAIETGLRDYYSTKLTPAGEQLPAPRDRGVFQRLPDARGLFIKDHQFDLSTAVEWDTMQLIMVHRHLYAHREGFVDRRYVTNIEELTGRDISPALATRGYPDIAVTWFEPLRDIDDFVTAGKAFFSSLPA